MHLPRDWRPQTVMASAAVLPCETLREPLHRGREHHDRGHAAVALERSSVQRLLPQDGKEGSTSRVRHSLAISRRDTRVRDVVAEDFHG